MGHDCAWMGVGDVYPAVFTASSNDCGHPPSSNVCIGSGTTIPCGDLTVISCFPRYACPPSVVPYFISVIPYPPARSYASGGGAL